MGLLARINLTVVLSLAPMFAAIYAIAFLLAAGDGITEFLGLPDVLNIPVHRLSQFVRADLYMLLAIGSAAVLSAYVGLDDGRARTLAGKTKVVLTWLLYAVLWDAYTWFYLLRPFWHDRLEFGGLLILGVKLDVVTIGLFYCVVGAGRSSFDFTRQAYRKYIRFSLPLILVILALNTIYDGITKGEDLAAGHGTAVKLATCREQTEFSARVVLHISDGLIYRRDLPDPVDASRIRFVTMDCLQTIEVTGEE